MGDAMKVIFGMACDGRVYPDFPGEREGVLGDFVVGPLGLTELLEIELGMTAPQDPAAVRVAAYAAKLKAALMAKPAIFCSAAFASDPWGVSGTLLEWRDALVGAGWKVQTCGSGRIDDLVWVEGQAPQLPSGSSDRLCALIEALESQPTLRLAAVSLVEPHDYLPAPIRRLIDTLADCGVAISTLPTPKATVASDLQRAQTFLDHGAVDLLVGDGTLVTIEADTSLMAAEAVADWLAASPDADLADTVILSPDGDTALLDAALEARGLPALGQSAASPWRGALQILPLAFAANWAPFNAKVLLDLLMLPRPPIGRGAARKLARALAREPGTGRAIWAQAWADIEADLAQRFADSPTAVDDVATKMAQWKEWMTSGLHDRATGIPAADARRIAARVSSWAADTDAGKGDPLLMSVSAAGLALAQAIEALGEDLLPALLIERMIEQVLADGAKNPQHIATAGGLRSTAHPAAIWNSVPRLVWWDFKGPGERVPVMPWSLAERAALETVGCVLDPPDVAAQRIGWGYVNAVRQSRERLVLVRPSLAGGEETISHPLSHQLAPLSAPNGAARWRAEHLLSGTHQELAGRILPRVGIALTERPGAQPVWNLPAAASAKIAGRTESATSFEHLIDCHMRWMLLDVLRLSRGRFAEIPDANQLLGNLAHEIANQVLQPGPVEEAALIADKVNAVFDELLGAIASPLQQPELAGELAAARVRVPDSLVRLAELLRHKGLDVVGTELERAASFPDGLEVQGRLDLVVRDAQLKLGVIDLKWTRSAKRRVTEFSEGRAFQLATYSAIADPETDVPADGAYYLLNQRQLVGLSGSRLADDEVEGQSLAATWAGLIGTWASWRNLALGGKMVATGIAENEIHRPDALGHAPGEAPCQYCELTSLCRIYEGTTGP
jgi:ATP-dependent helicase/nuclease subunit B